VIKSTVTGNIAIFKWNTGVTTPDLPVTAIGKYWLEVTSDKGCKSADTLNLSDNPVNNWQAPNDTSICGNSISLTMSGYPAGTTFSWNDGVPGAVRNFTSSGTYTVTARYIGCERRDNVDVGVHAIPVVNLGNDTFYCATMPNNLRSNVTGNISGFAWNTGANTPNITINGTGTYWMEATTAFGCVHRDSINVNDNPINSWQALADTSICDKTIHTVQLKNYPAGTGFSWYDGRTSATHDFSLAGRYKVTANYIGCAKQDSVTISVRPLPVIEVGKDTIICTDFSLPLSVSHPGATYLWSNGFTDSGIVVKSTGLYWVKATLNGCTYADSITASFVDCNCRVSVPNAFSPNQDGVNDLLKVHIECMPRNYRLSIFNRNGQRVFETTDMFKAWNGEFNDNKLPVGTYYYILTYYNDGFKRNELYKGYIVLLK
jgi:gliding motility-associated-like protein